VEGIDTAADGVKRQFADGDRQTAVALIADAKDGRGVGGDDHSHIVPREVADHAGGAVDVERRERQSTRILVQMTELLHRLPDGRRVDDGHHFFEMPLQQGVEQRFGPFLQSA